MIAVDTNILVYAHRREPREHEIALRLMRALAGGSQGWAIPWPCVYEFFSVVTHPRIWKESASTPKQAWEQLRAWFDAPLISLIGEGAEYLQILERCANRPNIRGPVIHDARIAAICLAHGVKKLFSADRDFHLFPTLAVENPFV